jgi:hypothetical protein
VSAATDRDLRPLVASIVDRDHDVSDAAAPCDQAGMLVDHAVVDTARLVVALLAGAKQLARERLEADAQLSDSCHEASSCN